MCLISFEINSAEMIDYQSTQPCYYLRGFDNGVNTKLDPVMAKILANFNGRNFMFLNRSDVSFLRIAF